MERLYRGVQINSVRGAWLRSERFTVRIPVANPHFSFMQRSLSSIQQHIRSTSYSALTTENNTLFVIKAFVVCIFACCTQMSFSHCGVSTETTIFPAPVVRGFLHRLHLGVPWLLIHIVSENDASFPSTTFVGSSPKVKLNLTFTVSFSKLVQLLICSMYECELFYKAIPHATGAKEVDRWDVASCRSPSPLN